MSTFESEAIVTRFAKKRFTEEGMLFVKISDRYKSGLPDSFVIFQGRTFFLELKRSKEGPKKNQAAFGRLIRRHGGHWTCLNSKALVEAFIAFAKALPATSAIPALPEAF